MERKKSEDTWKWIGRADSALSLGLGLTTVIGSAILIGSGVLIAVINRLGVPWWQAAIDGVMAIVAIWAVVYGVIGVRSRREARRQALLAIPHSTEVVVPFAVRTKSSDTMIAVANTTSRHGALPEDSLLTFNFYPQGSGSPFTYTTALGHPGVGLGATGVLTGGKTYTVRLSELLDAILGAPTWFTGYLTVRANVRDMEVSAVVMNFQSTTFPVSTRRMGLGE